MIKEENILEREKGLYFQTVHIRCEKCGDVFIRQKVNARSSPICGKCWRAQESELNRERARKHKEYVKSLEKENKRLKEELERLKNILADDRK